MDESPSKTGDISSYSFADDGNFLHPSYSLTLTPILLYLLCISLYTCASTSELSY